MQCSHFLVISTNIALGLALAAPLAPAANFTKGQLVAPFTREFNAGDYVWCPDLSPAGPVIIVISLPEQVLYVYRNGVRIGRSTISSGKARHHTPTGVFTILQKDVKHTSNVFKGASMPYMERLTWGGVAMHAGNLPGYPASHGCVRLPLDFAQMLYTVTSDGMTVIVTDSKPTPDGTAVPSLLFAATPGEVAPPGGIVWKPEKASTGQVSIIVSSADGAAYVYRNGVEIGRAPVGGLGGFTGWYVYSALADIDTKGQHGWLSTVGAGGIAPNIRELSKKVGVDQQFLDGVRTMITLGTTLILTDAPVSVSTRNGMSSNIHTTTETP